MDLSVYSATTHSRLHMGPPPFPPLSARKGSLAAREKEARVAALTALYFDLRGERSPNMEALLAFAQSIREEPPEVTECEDLNLSCEKLRQIPSLITCFRGLTKLNISDNELEILPEAIGELSNLKWLNASRNRLFTLPVALSRCSRLKVLKLSGNQLTMLAAFQIRGLSRLNRLDLSENRISYVTREITCLTSLKFLDLSENGIMVLEALPRLLQSLYLGDNPLSAIPDCLAFLPNFEYLDVHGLELASIPSWLDRRKTVGIEGLEDDVKVVDAEMPTPTDRLREVRRHPLDVLVPRHRPPSSLGARPPSSDDRVVEKRRRVEEL